jgi:hypothetical protein
VLLEIVHIEVAVGLEPVLVSFDGKGSNEVPSRLVLELVSASSGGMRLSDHAARSMV